MFRAAATALRTIASNEILVQKRIRFLDYSTDGPAEAEALRELAASLEASADEHEGADAGFDWAEMVHNPFTYRDRLINEMLRES